MINAREVREQAERELEVEAFRAAVTEAKVKLRLRKSIWDRLVPFTFKITRK
jgi:hypothetical protein